MPDQTLGHYRLESQLGSGGMGVVHLATDTRLGRKVAIKFLHQRLLDDPDSRDRFEREARVLASLNHPQIGAIHGLEEVGGVKFLVLEYVPGETLAQRLRKAPLSVREALSLGREIASALEAAHEAGVIHRDLKPANIMITPEAKVKVLDFGLAKAHSSAKPGGEEAATVTLTLEMTQPGVVMGTASYMSPEQASGKPVDRRTDIWAFGCVLYEALSRQRTFAGETATEILAGILGGEPNWDVLPANTPENIRRLLRRCLAKDPRSRLRDMADARLELEDTLAGSLTGAAAPVAQRRGDWFRILPGIAGMLLIAAVGVGIWFWRGPRVAAPPRVARFNFDLPQGSRMTPSWTGWLTFSRDSKTVAYLVNAPPPGVVYTRQIDELEGKILASAKGLGVPVYSPDNRWLAMPDFAKGMLVKVPASGGAPLPIAAYDMNFRGDWSTDGNIYWTKSMTGGIIRTPQDGGKEESVTKVDLEKQERTHRFAKLVPGGKALLFTVASAGIESYDDARIDALDLVTNKRKALVQGGTFARYSPSGHIVYARGGALYAVPFDAGSLEVTGTSVKVLEGVLMSGNIGTAYFDISPSGDLAYAAGPAENGERQLVWVDRKGAPTPLPLPPRPYLNPRLSPDGKLLAVEVEGPNHDFYSYDFARAVTSRITNDGSSHAPIWSPDGKHIAYRTTKYGRMDLAWMPSDRSGPEEILLKQPSWQSAVSFSPDGKYLAFDQSVPNTEYGTWVLPLTGERKPLPFTRSKFQQGAAKFSPDGKWVVYCSMESGKAEVYVQTWPGPGPKIQISSEGGLDPLWRHDGKEIFYRNGTKMMAVSVNLEGGCQAGRPQVLWEGEYTYGLSSSCGVKGATITSYDVSADGQRFLMIKDNDQKLYATKIVVVLNWAEELKRIMAEAAGKKI